MICVVIPVFNRWKFTKECLDSLRCQTFKDYKVIIIDHGSTDGTREYILRDYPWVILLLGDESMWWTAAMNLGVRHALECGADFILTLNNDLTVLPDYLEQLVHASEKYPNSIIGSVSVDNKNRECIAFAGVSWNQFTAKYKPVIPASTPFSLLKRQYSVIASDLLPGRGVLIPSDAFTKVGLYDLDHFPHYAADEDFSRRCIKCGYNLLVCTSTAVFSEIEATGLNNVYKKNSLKYIINSFTSIRSPNNLSVRWCWAMKHGKIPLLYFLIDSIRIAVSLLIKPYR